MMRVFIPTTYNNQKRVLASAAGTLFYLPDSIVYTPT